jgi:hypothetical protein
METRDELEIGDRVLEGAHLTLGTVVPTSPRVPLGEVNVMADRTGAVHTFAVKLITVVSAVPR